MLMLIICYYKVISQ